MKKRLCKAIAFYMLTQYDIKTEFFKMLCFFCHERAIRVVRTYKTDECSICGVSRAYARVRLSYN